MVSKYLLYGFLTLVVALSLAAGLTLVQAAPWRAPSAQGGAPTVVSYQGTVKVGGTPYDGTGYFKFAIVDSGGNYYWSNDGTKGVPSQSVQLDVAGGFFSVLLGDTSLGGMTQPLDASVFNSTDRYLRVWFSEDGTTFTQLSDVRIASVPYALQAEEAGHADSADSVPWGGVSGAPDFREKFANVVVVAESGGDFTSIQDAIDSITDASADNPYLVWVAPGTYTEKSGAIRMKPYVHIQGAGQDATIIAGSSVSRTLILTSYVTLRDLTVQNPCGPGSTAGVTAIRAQAGTTGTLVSNVKVWSSNASGSCEATWGMVIRGPDTSVTLQDVTALAEGGNQDNTGLWVFEGASVTIRGGSFTAKGGDYAYGIYVTTVSQPGTFVGADGTYAFASGATTNFGFYNQNSASAFLQGGYFRASGGNYAYGIRNSNSATLEAEGITVLGERGGSSYGLYNDDASATLRGGSFVALGSGGSTAIAIENSGGTIEAHDLSARAEGASMGNYAWKGEMLDSEQRIYGGTFIGRGGSTAYGISVLGTGSIQGVYAVGENGSSATVGLYVSSNGTVDAHDSRFKGNPAVKTYGTLYLALSQVDGGITKNAGTVTCYGVYDENYNFYACP